MVRVKSQGACTCSGTTKKHQFSTAGRTNSPQLIVTGIYTLHDSIKVT